ncbi:hypothetical protein Tco_1472783, partial [Tanacetum coccineum]
SKAAQSTKEKQPATKSKAKGLTVLSKVALTEDEQMNLATKKSQIQTHNSHASNKGAGDKPEVPDVPKYNSDGEEESWTFSDGDDDEDVNEESDAHDDNDENKLDDEDGEEYDDEEMLYGDLNLNRERIYARRTEAHATKETEDANVNLTAVTPVVQMQSSSASDLVSKFINPSMDEGIDSVLNQNIQSATLVDIPVTTTTETPSSDTTTLQPSTLNIHSFQTPRVTALESELSMLKQSNPFAEPFLLFLVKAQTSKIMSKLEKYVTDTLGDEVLVRSTNQPQTSYAIASSLSELELKNILMDKMEENKSIDKSEVQKNLYNALVEAYMSHLENGRNSGMQHNDQS